MIDAGADRGAAETVGEQDELVLVFSKHLQMERFSRAGPV